MLSEFVKISPRITALPIIHGSGDYAIEVRRVMLSENYDCIAVPLPPSFQADVERAIPFLPSLSAVVQPEQPAMTKISESWSEPADEEQDDRSICSYVPIDPCQGVITALRIAMQERIARAFVDMETEHFESYSAILPDPYALKNVQADRFAAAILPATPSLPSGQPQHRVLHMANRLRQLEKSYSSILFICSLPEWPWVREAYSEGNSTIQEEDEVQETQLYAIDPERALFLLGELPFVTGLYERARVELGNDENLSIDGIKEMVLTARDVYSQELQSRARKITPKLMASYFQYVRNLSLVERRLTPDLYTLIVAAQQIMGDQFAVHLAETARTYCFDGLLPFAQLEFGIDEARFPDGDAKLMISRLPGQPISWRGV